MDESDITESDQIAYKEAINDVDADHCVKDMESELELMYSNKV